MHCPARQTVRAEKAGSGGDTMKNIWVDYGSMHIERENDARLLALHYVLGNRDALQLLGVSTSDDATREVLTKLLRQAGYPAAVDEVQQPRPCPAAKRR